jgi:hypothetical protein
VAAGAEEGGTAQHGSEGRPAVEFQEFQGRSTEQWRQSWRGSSTQYELHAEAGRRKREKIRGGSAQRQDLSEAKHRKWAAPWRACSKAAANGLKARSR